MEHKNHAFQPAGSIGLHSQWQGHPNPSHSNHQSYGYLPPNQMRPHYPMQYTPGQLQLQPLNQREVETMKIDQELESGFYGCYKHFLYVIAIWGIFRFSIQDLVFLGAFKFFSTKIFSSMLIAYAIFMQLAYNKKELSKAKWAVMITMFVFIGYFIKLYIEYLGLKMNYNRTTTQSSWNVYCVVAGLEFFALIFGVIIPAINVKNLLMKRETSQIVIFDPILFEPPITDI